MLVALGCVALGAIIYRFRRDVTGPPLTARSEAASRVSFGALLLWVAADWLSGSTDQWFSTTAGALPLAVVEVGCLAVITCDTFRSRGRHGSDPGPRRGVGGHQQGPG